jgi:hypothetical protein
MKKVINVVHLQILLNLVIHQLFCSKNAPYHRRWDKIEGCEL